LHQSPSSDETIAEKDNLCSIGNLMVS
jgi:hypothetical protein